MTRFRRIEFRTNSRADAPAWTSSATSFGATISADSIGGPASLRDGQGRLSRTWVNPLDALASMGDEDSHPTLNADRWVGYMAYDLGRAFERLPSAPSDDLDLPLFAFAKAASDRNGREVAGTTPAAVPASRPITVSEIASTFSRPAYLAAVAKAIEYVRAGDVFQVNLAQRLSVPWAQPAADLFRRLTAAGGARYGALLDLGDFSLVSNSPELFFRVEPLPDGRRRIVSRPIKGTRPLLPGMDRELLASEKDKAELTMIVDLQRNDLGRICEIGTVKVTEPRAIEEHPTVYHGVATIEGILRSDVGFVDILRAVFPCGSITGCPKVRAMEIIDELEPVRRGPYCGAIGWVGAGGAMEFSVAIRTTVLKDGVAHVSVGGGIVADSDPSAEYEETMVKAAATLAALGVAGNL